MQLLYTAAAAAAAAAAADASSRITLQLQRNTRATAAHIRPRTTTSANFLTGTEKKSVIKLFGVF